MEDEELDLIDLILIFPIMAFCFLCGALIIIIARPVYSAKCAWRWIYRNFIDMRSV